MLRRASQLFVALLCLLLAHQARAVWEFVQKDVSGAYAIYGAYLDDAVAPVAGDTKVAFRLTGAAAKDMFDAIGPDMRDGCPDPQIRIRNRDMLLCRHRPKDGYRYDFGFDLSTGLSIGGAVGGAVCGE
ncbi:hypothetical protein O0881_24740 [Janthinobacterium sp. SUN100]|uniref:hypothetical protein n=1 Tax=Janthinobacterium sp. SUN100 TaxID=3004101 RepID=UPI0025B22D45|nr:hypothetical protein [Janthinobacterium sp. SUN100]MDN2705203.1 hypothetical protein [Janthinobacterium sp. SUN100]